MLKLLRYAPHAVAALVALLVVSFVAGQCRANRQPKAPEPIPGFVDAGNVTPGPVAEAPTVVADPMQPAIPDLSRAELAQIAAKYGLELTKRGRKPSDAFKGDLRADLPRNDGIDPEVGEDENDQPAAKSGAPAEPVLLAEESAGPGPAGDRVEASAWFVGQGERVDLRFRWLPYQPPTPEQAKCDGSGYFGNVAKFHGFIGGGGVATDAGAGLGAFGGLGYRGFRIGKVKLGADAIGGYGQDSGGFVAGGLTLAF